MLPRRCLATAASPAFAPQLLQTFWLAQDELESQARRRRAAAAAAVDAAPALRRAAARESSTAWLDGEVEKLARLVNKYGSGTWEVKAGYINDEFGRGRSANAVKNKWRNSAYGRGASGAVPFGGRVRGGGGPGAAAAPAAAAAAPQRPASTFGQRPQLLRELVQRGREGSAAGAVWRDTTQLEARLDELRSIAQDGSVDAVRIAARHPELLELPKGLIERNAAGLRGLGVDTLSVARVGPLLLAADPYVVFGELARLRDIVPLPDPTHPKPLALLASIGPGQLNEVIDALEAEFAGLDLGKMLLAQPLLMDRGVAPIVRARSLLRGLLAAGGDGVFDGVDVDAIVECQPRLLNADVTTAVASRLRRLRKLVPPRVLRDWTSPMVASALTQGHRSYDVLEFAATMRKHDNSWQGEFNRFKLLSMRWSGKRGWQARRSKGERFLEWQRRRKLRDLRRLVPQGPENLKAELLKTMPELVNADISGAAASVWRRTVALLGEEFVAQNVIPKTLMFPPAKLAKCLAATHEQLDRLEWSLEQEDAVYSDPLDLLFMSQRQWDAALHTPHGTRLAGFDAWQREKDAARSHDL